MSYPTHRETDVVLRDGRTVHLRPARPQDEAAVEDYLVGLSDETRRLRFWEVSLDVGETARSAVERRPQGARDPIGVDGCSASPGSSAERSSSRRRAPATAEVGISVADDLQGLGLGSLLIAHLAAAAAEEGIAWLHADVMPENHAMLQVFRETGFPSHCVRPARRRERRPADFAGPGAIEQYEARERTSGRQRRARLPAPEVDRGDRRLARSRVDRGTPAAEPACRAVRGRRLPRESERRRRAGRDLVPHGPGCSGTRRPRLRGRCRRGSCSRSRGTVWTRACVRWS